MSADAMVDALATYSKFPLPPNLPADLRELVGRYGRVRLRRVDGQLRLITDDRPLLEELARQKGVRDYLGERIDATSFAIDDAFRGVLKQALIAVGYPAEDLAGYTDGAALAIGLRDDRPVAACRSGSATTSGWPSTPSTPAATSGAARA